MNACRCFVAALLAYALGAAPALATDYKIDPMHSAVVFRIKHLDVSYVYGRFNRFSGSFRLDDDNSAFEIDIKADSVDTNSEGRDKHLRGPDFFGAAEFPDIRFKSTHVRRSGDNTFEVTGDLTMHGVTKEQKMSVEVVGANKKGPRGEIRGGFEATCTVKRSDFGMTYGGKMLGDDVRVIVAAEGIAQVAGQKPEER